VPAEPAGPVIRVRNKEVRLVKVSDIEDAPWNWRGHGEEQKKAFDALVEELGFYGHPDVYVTAEGKLRLVDGHLRKDRLLAKYGPAATIEVNVTDFTEAEAKKALLTKDPLAAMAETDYAKLQELLPQVEAEDESIKAMLAELAAGAPPSFEASVVQPTQAEIDAETDDQAQAFTEKFENDEKALVDVVCPECMNEFKVAVTKADVLGVTTA
jgi:hypothetical protein